MLGNTPPRSRASVRPNSRRRPVRRVNLFVLLLMLLVALSVAAVGGIYLLRASTVSIVVNGVIHSTRTLQGTVGALLAELQVTLDPQDDLSPSSDTPIRNGMTITIDKAKPVIVDVDGQRRRVMTRAIQPRDILAQAGIAMGEHDVFYVDNAPFKQEQYTNTPGSIQVVRAITIRVDDNQALTTIQTVQRTVGGALYDAGLVLFVGDSISPAPGAPITEGSQITIRRSVPVTVQVDGRTLTTRTHGQTVGAALAEIGIALVGLDLVTPDISTPVAPDMTIRVIRVTEEDIVTGTTPIGFKQVSKEDPTLPLDTKQVIQTGVEGMIEQRIHIRREDGLEVSRSAVENVVVRAARDEITAIGTLATFKALDTPDGQIQYWRILKMHAVSYKPASAGRSRDDPKYGITATGERLRKGLVAVDPTVIPLGTRLYIPGYGLAVAADTGGGVKGLIIDLGYSDDDYQEWSTSVEVYLLGPIPDKIPTIPGAVP
jgi:uncharacterized protein YabE (DUF348 family)